MHRSRHSRRSLVGFQATAGLPPLIHLYVSGEWVGPGAISGDGAGAIFEERRQGGRHGSAKTVVARGSTKTAEAQERPAAGTLFVVLRRRRGSDSSFAPRPVCKPCAPVRSFVS